MAINPYHTIEEISGVRCSVVEKKVAEDRAMFLKKVLEHNNMTVYMTKGEDGSYTIGVDNILFNPVNAIYNRSLRTLEGRVLLPAYWYQKQQNDQYYWNYR